MLRCLTFPTPCLSSIDVAAVLSVPTLSVAGFRVSPVISVLASSISSSKCLNVVPR